MTCSNMANLQYRKFFLRNQSVEYVVLANIFLVFHSTVIFFFLEDRGKLLAGQGVKCQFITI